jgi:site-specific DNA-methyltransferase (adenine-specific)
MQSNYILGDSWEEIPKLPDDFFRLVLADPPFEISRDNNFSTMGRTMDFGKWDYNFDQTSWIDLIYPKLKKNGSLVIFNDWKKIGQVAQYAEKVGFIIKRPLTWVKNNPNPANAKRLFLQGTEHAVWLVKGDKWVYNSTYHKGYFNYPVQRSEHPTKKPDGLYSELISILTNPGDFVLDPFSGSGTTGMCAAKLNRNFICIEKEETYHNIALAIAKESNEISN